MAKKTWVNVSGTWKEVKNVWNNVAGVWKENVMPKINVTGVWKICISYITQINKHANATNMSEYKYGMMTAKTDNYALIAGGIGGVSDTFTKSVNAYNKSLTRSSPTQLSVARRYGGGANAGLNMVIIGGEEQSNQNTNYADAYNNDLTKVTITNAIANAINYRGAPVGDYAVFLAGVEGTAYNSSLVRQSCTPLRYNTAAVNPKGTSNNQYAFFPLGVYGEIDVYNTSLTRLSVVAGYTYPRGSHGTATFQDLVIIAGGRSSNKNRDYVEAYNDSLTKLTNPTVLSSTANNPGSTNTENFAVFAGGYNSSNDIIDVVNSYDKSLVRKIETSLQSTRNLIEGVSVGGYALLAGGYVEGYDNTAVVEVYEEVSI